MRKPVYAHPLVRRLCAEAEAQGMPLAQLAHRAGVSPETLKDWRRKSTPNVATLEACFNVIGYTLQPRKIDAGGAP